jgi:hypothetical protein
MKVSLKSLIVNLATPLFLFIALWVMYKAFSLLQVELKPILSIVLSLSPVWLPLLLFYILFDMWSWFIQTKFKVENGRTTLRIKLPQEVFKSPEAMESVFSQIHNSGRADNLMQTYLDGRHSLVNSFELVSIGGDVRFYVNVPTKKVKNAVEAQLYAQYPGIEVVEEPVDYTSEVVWDPKIWDFISFHLVKKDESLFPIKTYVDFGMDKLPKEELKFEPMAPLIEHLGKVKPHERIWVQILMTAHDKQSFTTGSLTKVPTWEVKAYAKIDEIMQRNTSHLGTEETESRPVLTMSERDTISAIERNVSKYAYNVSIRAMYITKTGKFDADMISPLLKSFSQYDVIGRTGIGVRWRTDFNYNFISDYSGRRKYFMKKNELESYKARFYIPGDKKKGVDAMKVMSVEELATIYHIPGTSVVTPSLTRVESSRKEAPSNLPIEQ